MSLYRRPRLGPGLLGLPRRLPLSRADGQRWRSESLRVGPLVRDSEPGVVVVVELFLPPGSGLHFVESGGPLLQARFEPPAADRPYVGPALTPMTIESTGPPRFSHVLVGVRAYFLDHGDVYLRQRVVILR